MSPLPEEISLVYKEIQKEVLTLHIKWNIYRQLYAHSEERINVLNKCAPLFFALMQDILWDNVLLSINRLSDPPESRRGNNLSIAQLHKRVKKSIDENTSIKICRILSSFKNISNNNFVPHRNKRIAHFDLNLSISEKVHSLPEISREKIETALYLIREYLNTIENYFDLGEVLYKDVIVNDDAEDLIDILEKGLGYQDNLMEQLKKRLESLQRMSEKL